MATLLLVLVVVLVIGGLVYGVVSLLSGDDPGLVPAEPDGRARPLPNDRSLHEDDLKEIRFDVVLRGYRMAQVDRMLRRVAYDLGYKDEMIAVLEAEVAALREGRLEDAELLRKAREAASTPEPPGSSRMADLGETRPGIDVGPDATGGASPDGPLAAVGPDRTVTDDSDRTAVDDSDRTVSDEPELPREGSLRRRSPLAAPVDAADVTGGGPSPDAVDGTPEPDRTPGLDGAREVEGAAEVEDAPAVDGADRPAHA